MAQEDYSRQEGRMSMCETAENLMIEETAYYALDLPQGAVFHHARLLPDGNIYRYYWIEDEEGGRWVYTDERFQELNRKMAEATKRLQQRKRA